MFFDNTYCDQHCSWQHGQEDQVHPQQVHQHQAVWYGWHTGGKGCYSEGLWQASEIGFAVKCKVLHLSRCNPSISTVWVGNGSRKAWRRKTWGCLWTKSSLCAHNAESKFYPWVHQRHPGQQDEGEESVPLLWWDPACDTLYSSVVYNSIKTWIYWNKSRGKP